MPFEKCPTCKGKGKVILFTTVEDPCGDCNGDGLVEVESQDTDEFEFTLNFDDGDMDDVVERVLRNNFGSFD